MSFTDPTADPVQPDQGQGDAGASDAPYAEYLSRLPEEVRGDVEPVFRDWDASVTKRFQDAAEFRKQWEPLQDTGVHQLPRDDVSFLVQLRQAMDDPQVMQQWWNSYAEQNGLAQQQQQQQQDPALQQLQQFDEFGLQDPNQQYEQLLSQRLSPLEQQLQQLVGRLDTFDQQQAQAAARAHIEGQMAALQEAHGDEFNRDAVELFVANFMEQDPRNAVNLAWEQYQTMRNQITKNALQSKVNDPAPAVTGTVSDASPEKLTNFKQAESVARQFLQNMNRA